MTTAPHKHEYGPTEEDLARCVHCGFCLQACPTYVVLGLETESPRGRIQLSRALMEGRLDASPATVAHFDLCLQCRACETACPSGVEYGRIIETTRAYIQTRPERPKSWRVRSFVLRLLFGKPWRLRALFSGLRLYQRTPIAPIVRRILPKRLRDVEAMAPKLTRPFFKSPAIAANPPGASVTVAMLTGCVMPLTNPDTHEATVRVLARNSCRVLVPEAQVCCGALHVHNGDPEAARRLARKNIDVFLKTGADYFVINSAGCGSAIKEYGELLAADPAYVDKARTFASKVRDVNELLVVLPFEAPTGRIDARVTYQDSCHLLHAQKIREAPRQILRSIPGVELVEMSTPDRCCGSAGIYNVTQTEMSRRLLADKMTDVNTTACDLITTANPGCMLQLDLGVRLQDGTQEVLHVVDLLDRAYAAEGENPKG